MSYLLDLVKTLDEGELKKFKQLDVSGKAELIRDAYVAAYTDTKFDELKLPAKFGLSIAHFDKNTSLLLSRLLHSMYGDNYGEMFRGLHRKSLSALMVHKMKIAEREVVKAANKKKLVEFYRAAFEGASLMFHPQYNPQLTRAYGRRYLAALGSKKNIAEEFFVAMRIHQCDMLANSVAGNEVGFNNEAWRVLKQWKKKLDGTKNPYAHFHYYFTLGNCIKYYGTSAADFIAANEKCLQILPKLNTYMKQSYGFRLNCELGFGYIEAERFELAEQCYAKAYNLPWAASQARAYQSGCYLNVCLINRNYKQATWVFNRYLKNQLGPGVNRSSRFDVLLNALMLQLHVRNYEEAFKYLHDMRTYKRNEITHHGQVFIRLCETLYFYAVGDMVLAQRLANKNMRFLQRPENKNLQFDYHRELFSCVLQFARTKNARKPITPAMEQRKKALRGGLYRLFNNLL